MITFKVDRDVKTALSVLQSIKRNRDSLTSYKLINYAGISSENPALNDLDKRLVIAKDGSFISLAVITMITVSGDGIPNGTFEQSQIDSLAADGDIICQAVNRCKNTLPGDVLGDSSDSILDDVLQEALNDERQKRETAKELEVVEFHEMTRGPEKAASLLAEMVKVHLESGRKVAASSVTYDSSYSGYLVVVIGVKEN